jgi:L-ribulose-5-phosphate 3-epimerase
MRVGEGVVRLRLGVSTYSYWHFRGAPYPPERVLDDAARLGLDGVEVLEVQLGEDRTASRLHRLRRRALALGLDLYALSTHQDFVQPQPEAREAEVRRTVASLEVAAALGVGCIRLNSGRWKTIARFDELMAAGGREPPLPGYSDDEAFRWVEDCIARLLPEAERRGVVLALENHWGLTATADGVLRLTRPFDSPYLAALLDTGNFREATYEQIAMLAPYALLVHAKSYEGGGEWYELDIDYARVARILQGAGFAGYVSLEFEGRADPAVGVPQAVERLRRALAAAG